VTSAEGGKGTLTCGLRFPVVSGRNHSVSDVMRDRYGINRVLKTVIHLAPGINCFLGVAPVRRLDAIRARDVS
jgi:hypothetical protein